MSPPCRSIGCWTCCRRRVTEPYFANLKRLETSPITSVHLWCDRPIMQLPHAVLIDCLGQWVFNRGEVARRTLRAGRRQCRPAAPRPGQRRDPAADRRGTAVAVSGRRAATLLRGRVVTEHAATFSAVPGVDRWRPGPRRRSRTCSSPAIGPRPAGRRRWKGRCAAATWRPRRFCGGPGIALSIVQPRPRADPVGGFIAFHGAGWH